MDRALSVLKSSSGQAVRATICTIGASHARATEERRACTTAAARVDVSCVTTATFLDRIGKSVVDPGWSASRSCVMYPIARGDAKVY